MSVRKFSTASILSPSYKNSKLWDQTTLPGSFEAIATAVVDSSGASSITFSNIPSVYKHLQLRLLARTDRSGYTQDGIKLIFNSDTTANYSNHDIYGSGSATGAGALTGGSATYLRTFAIPAASASASIFGVSIIDILDYTSTSKTKTFRALTGADQNGSGEIDLSSGNWRTTASAIDTIAISSINAASWVSGTHAALYGLRG